VSRARGARKLPATRRGTLSRDAVLEAALQLAREDDLARLTMQRLADALGVTPMALYRHVRNKAELVDAVMDRFVQEAAVTAHGVSPDHWKEWLRRTFAAQRSALLAAPGVLAYLSSGARFGPGAQAIMDETLGVLRGAGISARAAAQAFSVLTAFTLGACVLELAWKRGMAPGDRREAQRQSHRQLEALPSGSFPNTVVLAPELARLMTAFPFELGLEAILDRLAAADR